MKKFDTVISSKHKLLKLNIKEVWKYRDLIWLHTKRSFSVTYKQTILGPLWMFLTPLISSLIYAFVFGGIAGLSPQGIPTLLFYMGGNAVWTFFSTCLTKISSTFTDNATTFGKVYFPRLTMPISTVLFSAINFGLQMIMFLAFWGYYVAVGEVSPNYWAIALMIPVLIQLGVLAMGFGVIISSLTTKYRDLAILVTFGVQLWMYVTPVVFPLSTITEEWMRTVLLINPVTCGVETFRYIFLGTGTFDLAWWGITALTTIAVFLLGLILFNKVERTFMDTV